MAVEIQPGRITALNDREVGRGKYVLYWMQQSQRAVGNHALEYALIRGNELGLPVVAGFGLMDAYPESNLRHYRFMLEGLAETSEQLQRRRVGWVIRQGKPAEVALELAKDAALVVCDRGYLKQQRRWREQVADLSPVAVVQVESDVVVPVDEVSDKAEYAARTIRPKINRLREQYLLPVPQVPVQVKAGRIRINSDFGLADLEGTLARIKVDRGVLPAHRFHGGLRAAKRWLGEFCQGKLKGYADNRGEVGEEIVSHMGPYLHFGQIGAVEVALEVRAAAASTQDKEAFLEELIIRRELSCNFVEFTPDYDRYEALPAWAKRSLQRHASDRRDYHYSRRQLEEARTHDRYWNAAMREMLCTGYMHNYMRMYWGKKVLEWKAEPQEAFADLLYLNNKYFLDGRDPNSYAGVAWCFGLHDRPWGERTIFGQVRFMNASGLERKFDMEGYLKRVAELEQRK